MRADSSASRSAATGLKGAAARATAASSQLLKQVEEDKKERRYVARKRHEGFLHPWPSCPCCADGRDCSGEMTALVAFVSHHSDTVPEGKSVPSASSPAELDCFMS